jgi:hypothetical protein
MSSPAPRFPTTPLASHTTTPHPDVLGLQAALIARGCGPTGTDGLFDAATILAVKRFQIRFSDAFGRPLTVDGLVGPLTWEALFGPAAEPTISDATASLAADALEVAVAEIGVLEEPLHSNRGRRVDEYVRAAGLDPAGRHPWCVAFVYWCFEQAAARSGRKNPLPRTAGVLKHWASAQKIARVAIVKGAEAVENPALIQPGFLFAMDFGGGVGHFGFVADFVNGHLVTVEGNTGPDGSREGVGVFRRRQRRLSNINLGYVDYSAF